MPSSGCCSLLLEPLQVVIGAAGAGAPTECADEGTSRIGERSTSGIRTLPRAERTRHPSMGSPGIARTMKQKAREHGGRAGEASGSASRACRNHGKMKPELRGGIKKQETEKIDAFLPRPSPETKCRIKVVW